MSQEVSKWFVNGLQAHLQVGYNPFTNHLLTSWDIQVGFLVSPVSSMAAMAWNSSVLKVLDVDKRNLVAAANDEEISNKMDGNLKLI